MILNGIGTKGIANGFCRAVGISKKYQTSITDYRFVIEENIYFSFQAIIPIAKQCMNCL